ncbi:YbaB/EbfC family nucleoid-associated protein [Nonomuraea sp. NPDC049152]|uniref:YbaB/EbfC family nucleoid-associated protein n=1 Tax=Nonomuraea sp. NPDC049152 TaxID=3154350 RepID=UPI0033DE8F6A
MMDGDFGTIDMDRIIKGADAQMARVEEMQQSLSTLVGRASDEDGLVSVEYASEGMRDLTLHPKAMRLSSGELAELIKTVFQEASADLQRQASELMAEVFGEDNPMRNFTDPEASMHDIRQARAAFDRTFEDVMGELDRISRRLDL